MTARFNSIQQATKAGYVPFYICAEQPGVGTMGQHYVNFDLVGDPTIDPLKPEALVYEPQANGTFKLVALDREVAVVRLAELVPRDAEESRVDIHELRHVLPPGLASGLGPPLRSSQRRSRPMTRHRSNDR